jgi:cytochrome c biogenesis protein CcdA
MIDSIKAIEIKSKKSNLIFYLTLTLAIVMTSLYFLFLTQTFPEPTTKIAGTIANVILLYLAWMIFNKLRTNPTELLISTEKIGFFEQKNWCEIPLSSVNSFNFKSFYNGTKWARQLILELTTGEQKAIELNGLDTNQAELERILNEKKSW